MMRSLLPFLALTVMTVGSAPPPARAASFDCRRAATADERAVCADPRLSELDDLLQTAFEQAKRRSGPVDPTKLARGFLADRRACGGDGSCIQARYLDVLAGMRDLGATVAPSPGADALAPAGKAPTQAALPTRIGSCVATQVEEVTPRLDFGRAPRSEDFDAGTAINFRNGGHQVSYERETELLRSRPGDPVRMCLVSVPRGCPPGDDRGRSYRVTNLRTGGSWTLPDSQHMCGGA